MIDIAEEITTLYKNAHASYSLIDIKSMALKIRVWYKKLLYFQKSSLTSSHVIRKIFDAQLHELFEVLRCRCKMWRSEADEVKVDCKCPCGNKIPAIELEFIYAQRNRGSKPPAVMMGNVDVSVSKELQKSALRKVRFK